MSVHTQHPTPFESPEAEAAWFRRERDRRCEANREIRRKEREARALVLVRAGGSGPCVCGEPRHAHRVLMGVDLGYGGSVAGHVLRRFIAGKCPAYQERGL